MTLRLIAMVALLAAATSVHGQRLSITRVFGEERQNVMARQIPEVLLRAFSEGNIPAYYPMDTRRNVGLAQFYQHFVGKEQAVATLTSGPAWFCDAKSPKVNEELSRCFSTKFELATGFVRGKPQVMWVRLLYDASCDPRGIDVLGPVFKIQGNSMDKLTAEQYRITNPQNPAISYSVRDILLLRLYKDRKPQD